jgi:hypothetical protein
MSDAVEMKVAIAVLETNYQHLSDGLEAVKQGMGTLSDKMDTMLTQMRDQNTRSTMRARMISALSHVATGGVTLAVAKLLHMPMPGN